MKLEDCGILKEDILNGIINKITDDFDDYISNKIDNKINTTVDSLISEKAKARIEIALQNKIDEYLDNTYQPVTAWGEKIGRPTTVGEIIQKSIQTFWTQKVDYNGKATDGYFGDNKTRAEYIITKIGNELMTGVVKNEFQAIINDSKKQLNEAMAKSLSEIIKKNFK